MSVFIKRFLFDPGVETLLEIESVNILDLEPPAVITGVGTGTVLCIGEFENGPFEPREVFGATDFKDTYGTFGYEYDGTAGGNPSARSRKADAALNAEFWNGNGFISLANKKFARLIVLRIDTSVGEVSFTRLPCLTGSPAPTFALFNAATLDFDAGNGSVSASWFGLAAQTISGAGVYPTTFTGGEKLTIAVDSPVEAKKIGPIDIVFQASDQLQVDVIARINATLGYAAASDAGGGTTRIVGRVEGSGGEVDITAIDVLVATATGFAVGTDVGSGNVVDLLSVTVAEVSAEVTATDSDVIADRDVSGLLRLCNIDTSNTTLDIEATSTAIGLGFTLPSSTDVTNAADPLNVDGVILAGTRVRNTGGDEWVTMQHLSVLASNRGPYTVKVRHALDDTTGVAANAGTVTKLPFPIGLGGFDVINLLPLAAALTDFQLDAKYVEAIPTTNVVGNVADETNIMFCARQSNAIRVALRQSALDASAEGALGRRAVIRPPLGTTRFAAKADAQPGVGAYRNQRVLYAFPGVQTGVSQIAARGAAGGVGFTDSGIIDVGFDGFVASVISQLPPEENPGQETTFLGGVLGIVSAATNPDVQSMTINDYTSFKANGIMAPRIADGTPVIQSGVTSVDPQVNPSLKTSARRTMADFIQDTLARRVKAFGKKLATRARRAAVWGEIDQFLDSLANPENVANQRIDSYSITDGTSPEHRALGLFRLIIRVKTLPSLDSIVLEMTVGETVQIDIVT
jgi:hypothetical protein